MEMARRMIFTTPRIYSSRSEEITSEAGFHRDLEKDEF
jgi:hypothetical protein